MEFTTKARGRGVFSGRFPLYLVTVSSIGAGYTGKVWLSFQAARAMDPTVLSRTVVWAVTGVCLVPDWAGLRGYLMSYPRVPVPTVGSQVVGSRVWGKV